MNTKKALSAALGLSISILVIELAGAALFRSNALMADALHIITDILAISFSLVALSISSRPPAGSSTYGFHRIEVVASLFNGFSLVGIVSVIMYTAYVRLLHPETIDVLGTVVFGILALALNVISSRMLNSAQSEIPGDEDSNVSSSAAHVMGDALASLAVIIGAIAVFFTGQQILDSVVSVFIGLIVLRSAIRIIRNGGAIILERSPIVNMQDLKQNLLSVKGVSDVHDLHVWKICSHITVASIHASLDANGKEKWMDVRKELESKLSTVGVQHVTIQLEDIPCAVSLDHRKSSQG